MTLFTKSKPECPPARHGLAGCMKLITSRRYPLGGILCPLWFFARLFVEAERDVAMGGQNPPQPDAEVANAFKLYGVDVVCHTKPYVAIMDIHSKIRVKATIDKRTMKVRRKK